MEFELVIAVEIKLKGRGESCGFKSICAQKRVYPKRKQSPAEEKQQKSKAGSFEG
jgi:hypothetical protein